MSKVNIQFLAVIAMIGALSQGPCFANGPNLKYVIESEVSYVDSCVTTSGAIVEGPKDLTTFRGTPHYKICPYFSNFAAYALLEDPTGSNVKVVKNWMKWVFNHLNPDGSIYDYYVDHLSGGTDLPSVDAYPLEKIPNFDSQDSYAATFLTLVRKYAEVMPGDISWLKSHSKELKLIGKALDATINYKTHKANHFSPNNHDGLSVAKLHYQAKYTMDNSEVNEGLKDMVWLEKNLITDGDPSFYKKLLKKNDAGFANLWDPAASAYYVYEGDVAPKWNTFYPDAECQLWPILCGVITPTSARATAIYDTFNSHFKNWQNGDPSVAPLGYIAALMKDRTRANTYLEYVQGLLEKGLDSRLGNVADAAWIIRAAEMIRRGSSN